MKYSIAITPYLNNRAFLYHTPLEDCEVIQLTPNDTIRAMNNGRLHAGVVPVAGLKQLDTQFEMFGDFGIASEGSVESVLFLSRIPFNEFTSSHRIKLTHESVSSVNLLALLFGYQHGFEQLPMIANDYEEYDGELLIGDGALKSRHNKQYHFSIDLSEQWMQLQRLPFVFARWVINKDTPMKFRVHLHQWLTSFVENEKKLQAIAAQHETQCSNMTYQQTMNYLNKIKTHIGIQERKAQVLYLSELEKYKPEFPWSENRQRKHYA